MNNNKEITAQNEQSNINMNKYEWDKAIIKLNANIDMNKYKWDTLV